MGNGDTFNKINWVNYNNE